MRKTAPFELSNDLWRRTDRRRHRFVKILGHAPAWDLVLSSKNPLENAGRKGHQSRRG